MASTKFLGRIGDEELRERFFGIVMGEGDRLVDMDISRSHDGYSPYDVTVTYETRLDGDDEDSTLTDTYEVDDYNITPFDWGGDTSGITLAWRRWMLGMFGEEYANWQGQGRITIIK